MLTKTENWLAVVSIPMERPGHSFAAAEVHANRLRAVERLGLLFCIPLLAVSLYIPSSVQAQAVPTAQQHRQELSIEEQPGLEPGPQDELLPPAFQRTSVFFRSNEMPG